MANVNIMYISRMSGIRHYWRGGLSHGQCTYTRMSGIRHHWRGGLSHGQCTYTKSVVYDQFPMANVHIQSLEREVFPM